MKHNRYASFDEGQGAAFETGKLTMEDLCQIAKSQGIIDQKVESRSYLKIF